jgi:hypothetical protein
MLSTCKLQCFKVVNTPTKLKTRLVFICELGIPRIYFAEKNSPFEIGLHANTHQVSGSTHGDEEINNLINKDNSPLTNA